MGSLMAIKGGGVQMILATPDFEYFVNQYMGVEAMEYFKALINDMREQVDCARDKTSSDLSSYESSLESNSACFDELIEDLETLKKALNSKRINKTLLNNILDQMKTKISNQI